MNAPSLIHTTGRTSQPVSVYYEQFEPSEPTARPLIVMIHGGAHSAECYQRTPDGRPGWVYRFVARGYPVVAPDWPGVGRSGFVPIDILDGETVVEGLSGLLRELDRPLVLLTHSMAGCYGWRLTELHHGQVMAVVGVAPSQPGNIQTVSPIVSETDTMLEIETFGRRMTIDKTAFNRPAEDTIRNKYIGASRYFPMQHLQSYTRGLLGLPPRILAQRRNVRGTQVRVSDPKKFAGKPVFVLLGSEDIDHPREVDEAIVFWLREQGAAADFCYLPDRGIVGNGHMMMLEKNSDDLADIMIDWLDRTLKR